MLTLRQQRKSCFALVTSHEQHCMVWIYRPLCRGCGKRVSSEPNRSHAQIPAPRLTTWKTTKSPLALCAPISVKGHWGTLRGLLGNLSKWGHVYKEYGSQCLLKNDSNDFCNDVICNCLWTHSSVSALKAGITFSTLSEPFTVEAIGFGLQASLPAF